ncbi:cation:proton antiporter [Butyrivibrio sp. AE2032]|uniref:cation:proton antiporter n=1 Tax=Butyrivibrio sp. AE2032 TaxID=1458463 RepID=UPI00054F6E31|nr:monovalent cation/H(+) antiporter subunit G [Butyrivibrio sp. AE2032]
MKISTLTFLLAALLIIAGMAVFAVGVIGIFRIKYVLNRVHAAAMLDSLGLLLISAGVMVIRGFSYDSAKLLMTIALFWIASPVCSHLLVTLEAATNQNLPQDARAVTLEELKKEEEE